MEIKNLKNFLADIKSPEFKWPEDDSLKILLKNQIITRAEMEELANVLKQLPQNLKLEKLQLSNCNLDDRDIATITDVCNFSNLETLDLSENKISNEGAKKLANKLTDATYLLELRLNHNNLNDEGVETIARAVADIEFDRPATFGNMLQMNCMGNYISSSSVEKVVDILKSSYKNWRVNFYIETPMTANSNELCSKANKELNPSTKMGDAVRPVEDVDMHGSLLRQVCGTRIRTDDIYTSSLLDQYNEKIKYLEEKFQDCEKKEKEIAQKLISQLKKLGEMVEKDVKPKAMRAFVTEEQAIEMNNSSGMVVLRATDKMLGNFLKQGKDLNLPALLFKYGTECQLGIKNWSNLQKLVAGVIVGVASIAAAVSAVIFWPLLLHPTFPDFVENLTKVVEKNPERVFYLAEQEFHKSIGTKGNFFESYGSVVTDISETAKHLQNEQSTTDQELAEKNSKNPKL